MKDERGGGGGGVSDHISPATQTHEIAQDWVHFSLVRSQVHSPCICEVVAVREVDSFD